MATPINGTSPVRVSYTANNETSPNVRKIINDINDKRKKKSDADVAAIEGSFILGGSIVALLSFLFLKSDDAIKVAGAELAAFGLYGIIKSNCCDDNKTPTPTQTPVK
jgi:hypothetical protein